MAWLEAMADRATDLYVTCTQPVCHISMTHESLTTGSDDCHNRHRGSVVSEERHR